MYTCIYQCGGSNLDSRAREIPGGRLIPIFFCVHLRILAVCREFYAQYSLIITANKMMKIVKQYPKSRPSTHLIPFFIRLKVMVLPAYRSFVRTPQAFFCTHSELTTLIIISCGLKFFNVKYLSNTPKVEIWGKTNKFCLNCLYG